MVAAGRCAGGARENEAREKRPVQMEEIGGDSYGHRR